MRYSHRHCAFPLAPSGRSCDGQLQQRHQPLRSPTAHGRQGRTGVAAVTVSVALTVAVFVAVPPLPVPLAVPIAICVTVSVPLSFAVTIPISLALTVEILRVWS